MIPYIGPEFILALRDLYSNQQNRPPLCQLAGSQRPLTAKRSAIASCMTRLRTWQASTATQRSSIRAMVARWLGSAQPKRVKRTDSAVDSTQAVGRAIAQIGLRLSDEREPQPEPMVARLDDSTQALVTIGAARERHRKRFFLIDGSPDDAITDHNHRADSCAGTCFDETQPWDIGSEEPVFARPDHCVQFGEVIERPGSEIRISLLRNSD